MAGKDRQRQLARQRYQRQTIRRVEKRRRARRRSAVLGSAVAVAVVLGGGSYLGVEFMNRRAAAKEAANTADCSYTKQSAGPAGGQAKDIGRPPQHPTSKTPYRATIATNRGTIVMDLYTKQAPCTTNSFRFLSNKNFYDGTRCHRLTTEGIYVLQCGDPSGTGRGGPGYRFGDENLDGATYPRGTVAMANSGPNTNGSQFFIVYKEGGLEPKYTPFGKVVKGLDIVDSIAEAGATDEQSPREDIAIEDVVIKQKT